MLKPLLMRRTQDLAFKSGLVGGVVVGEAVEGVATGADEDLAQRGVGDLDRHAGAYGRCCGSRGVGQNGGVVVARSTRSGGDGGRGQQAKE